MGVGTGRSNQSRSDSGVTVTDACTNTSVSILQKRGHADMLYDWQQLEARVVYKFVFAMSHASRACLTGGFMTVILVSLTYVSE